MNKKDSLEQRVIYGIIGISLLAYSFFPEIRSTIIVYGVIFLICRVIWKIAR
jgi:hypothetical protein